MTSEVIEDEKQFYLKAKTYWKQIPPTVDGMLGGYGHISSIDINSSRKFLQRFLRVGRSGVLSRRGCGSGGTAGSVSGSLVICWYLPQGLELGWWG
uniref:N-terminal Xaa-Pro-Lys N-methyltransferase 1 n=1 Tax=Microcebus murinus TaxID=30608 RepID=A0A8C5YDT9_MICMU